MKIVITEAKESDAEEVLAVLNSVIDERAYSAMDRSFSVEDERRYIKSLKGRERMFVAEVDGRVVGFEDVTTHQKLLGSTNHVATIGTFVLKEFRGKGIGSALIKNSFAFAKKHDYIKFSTQVRAKNKLALNFYKKFGFKEVGRYKKQVKIDGKYDDEILLEKFL